MTEFKVGDRVKAPSHSNWPDGIGTVVDVTSGGSVRVMPNNGFRYSRGCAGDFVGAGSFPPHHLALVEPECPVKVGDRVRATRVVEGEVVATERGVVTVLDDEGRKSDVLVKGEPQPAGKGRKLQFYPDRDGDTFEVLAPPRNKVKVGYVYRSLVARHRYVVIEGGELLSLQGYNTYPLTEEVEGLLADPNIYELVGPLV